MIYLTTYVCICSCENEKYLISITDESMITYDEVIESYAKLSLIGDNKKKSQ